MVRFPGGCGCDSQPAQVFAAHQGCAVRDGPDVDLDPLPLGMEATGPMLPPGLDLGHPVGCFQSLVVPLT